MTVDHGSGAAPVPDRADGGTAPGDAGPPGTPSSDGAKAPDNAEPRRLHPLTPVAKGWTAMAAAIAIFGQHAARTQETRLGIIVAGAVFLGALSWGLLSWAFTVYRIEDDDLRIDSGVMFRRTRHVHLGRLQAVDVVRPFIARLMGLAELRLQVAGGDSAEGSLRYVHEKDAQALRAELLARAAGVRPDAGEAPERPFVVVPMPVLIGSVLLSFATWGFLIPSAALVVVALTTGSAALLLGCIPLFVAAWQFTVGRVLRYFDFTLSESPDGLRLAHGLIEHRHQTVPPGRVQAVRIVQPLLWRPKGWVRVEVNVAGYGQDENNTENHESTLLPVATREVALGVLSRILPGVDVRAVPLTRVPKRARWHSPVRRRAMACGADDRVFVARRGVFRRETDVIPHAKVQSVRWTQGPVERRLRLATVHLDSTPGPVRVTASLRDVDEAFRLVDEQAERSRVGRRGEGPHRWSTRSGGSVDAVDR
ncbi:PH domain-containing protein [Yinghuangia sp. ASG 101]|uniref:PH domain-containing protein n=1 Tax=Yinghuangia sp. ASG 101 TaxID=2896848 RepID=UPI001E64120F|nr:PH domain-containing protein [Yinghuangia sp. ASG 101]UGQ09176.1 PH domain-containing protein [Yinghuangia sp. ASG 101]